MSFYAYRGGELRQVAAARGPESIGILYSVCTDLAGFSSEGGEEWKLMGPAPYGEPDPAPLEACPLSTLDRADLPHLCILEVVGSEPTQLGPGRCVLGMERGCLGCLTLPLSRSNDLGTTQALSLIL